MKAPERTGERRGAGVISDPKTLQHGSFELTCRIKDDNRGCR